MNGEYHFVSRWRVRGDLDEVATILSEPLELPRWWPSVYLTVRELEPVGPNGLGQVVELHTRGRLPYTLQWRFRVTEVDRPWRFALEASGDFVGRGVWTLEEDGADVLLTYDWRVRAEKPLLRRLSWLLRPLFAWNHRWAMAQGERSLRRELERRAAREVTPEPEDEVEAIARTRRFARAMVDGDADALETLLAAGFTYTHRSARVEPREELVASVRAGRLNARMDLEEISVRAYADTTIVQGLAHMRAGPADAPIVFDSHFTAVWVDTASSPRLVLYHSTGIAQE